MKALSTISRVIIAAGIFSLGIIVGRSTGPNIQESKEHVLNVSSKNDEPQTQDAQAWSPSISSASLFDDINTNDLQTLAQQAQASADDLENDALLLVLISEWAKKDPYAALAYASELPNRGDLVYVGLRKLAQKSPDGALDWISRNAMNAGERQYFLRAAYTGMALSDPAGTVARVEQIPASAQRDQLLSLTLNEWAKQDIHAAFDWLETTELNPQFTHIYNEVMGQYIEQDLEQAAALVSQMLSGDNKLSFASQVATQLAEKDVNQALEWLQTIDGNERKYALLGVMDRWASGAEGAEALNYLLQNSGEPNHQELFSMVAMKLARKDPETLTDEFNNMNESEQMITAQQLAAAYSINDPEVGIEWIQSLAAGSVRDEALKSTLASYKYSNVSQAFDLSETISNPALRTRQMREVLATWIPVNQEAAIQALDASSSLTADEKQAMLNQVTVNLKVDDYALPAKE
ncbi:MULTISPECIES: hypothetical protein [unclassified Lentimonas]|uniref:hypothetical protein n=1 Tax=unclassified Lentimonas TaxID=2630993 RepID=UPI0013233C87|nr:MULTISPECIES: hypothetical protein [unclassified Lentimonas]CAA6689757.1 Unannotated [Lentimonas sp. CC19]CAA6690639.1 Unannotated [Lentimonas sp. CC10]CAA7068894.1 Unannotated [Lentimonas sp. CC11]